MTINSNINSLIAQQYLNKATSYLTSSINRLSSGLRVNSAADDAAGLSIGNRFLAQARAFDIFSRNANDAVSYMQVADGALSNISDNLQRMDELRVQSSNAFLTDGDRASLDKEYQQLVQENTRIVNTTEYNGIKIFGGGRENFTTRLGQSDVTFSLSAALSLGGATTSGALADIFNTSGVGSIPASLTITNPGVINFGSGTSGTYNINVNQLAKGFIYKDAISSGALGNAASITNSNPAVATYAGGPVGSYAVTINSLASSYIYQKAVGAGSPVFGAAPAGASTINTNPAVATVNGTPSVGTYAINVTQAAQAYQITDTVGAGNPSFGYAGVNATSVAGQLNPNIVTANNNPATEGDYNVTVSQLGRNEISQSGNTAGGPAAYGRAAVGGLFGNSASTNTFNASYNGANFTVNIADGTYSRDDFVAAFNSAASAAGANVTAVLSGNQVVYTGADTGAAATLTLTNTSTYTLNLGGTANDNTGAIFQNSGGGGAGVTQTALDYQGSVTRTNLDGSTTNLGAFTDADGSNISIGGLSFNVASTASAGQTGVIRQRNASTNSFTINFGDGTAARTITLPSGQYSATDFVAAFNAAAGDKFTAAYDATTGKITYTGLAKGSNQTFTLTNNNPTVNATSNSNTFDTSNATVVKAAQDATGTVSTNGGAAVAFTDADGQNISSIPGISFNALAVGSTTVTQTAATPASNNTFTINFGDGSPSKTFNVNGGGTYTASDYVNAFNSAAGGKFIASYDSTSGKITYTGTESGAVKSLTVTSNNDDPSDPLFQVSPADATQTGTNYTGTVNGTAFTSTSSNITSSGLTFNALSVGSTNITVNTASTNSWKVDLGDGTTFNINLAPGTYTANDFVSQFNSKSGGKYTASYDGTNITYTSNLTGATVSALTITNQGDSAGNAFDLGDATVVQAGQDSTGTVNGAAFTSSTNSISSSGITFTALSIGTTSVTYTAGVTGALDARFGDVKTVTDSRAEEEKISSSLNMISSLRAKVGANISRLDSAVAQSKIAGQNYYAAMSRIMDADYAKETAFLTKNQILAQSAQSVLAIANQQGAQILNLIGTGFGAQGVR